MTDLAVADLSHIPVSQGLSVTLARASEGARISGAPEVSLEHVLAALCDDSDAADVLAACNIDAARLKSDVIAFLVQQQASEAPHSANVMVSASLMRILEAAAAAARGGRKRDINGAIVLAAIVGDGRSTAAQILQSYGLTFEGAIRALQSAMAQPRPVEMAPAEDVLARARERVQSRSAPSLREIMQDKPQALPAPPPQYDDIVAPPANWEPAFPAPQEPYVEPAPVAQEAVAPEPPVVLPAEEPAPVPAVEVVPPADTYVDATAPAPQAPAAMPAEAEVAAPELPVAAAPVQHAPVQHVPVASEMTAPPLAPAPPPPPPAPPAPAHAPPAAMPPPPPAGFSPSATPGAPPGNFAPDFRPPFPPAGGFPPPPMAPPPASHAPPPAFERPRTGPQPPPIPPPIPRPAPPPQAAPYGYGAPPSVRAPQGPPPQGAAAPPPSRPAAKRSPKPQSEMGQLSENVPRVMRSGVTERVEVRIARARVPNLTDGMDGSAQAWRHEVTVTNAMSVRIRAPEGGFFIETASPETQWVDNQVLGAGEDFASWRFQITPQRRGTAHLQIIVSARSVGADGLAAETAFPDQVVQVKVRTNYKRALVKSVGWIAAAVAGGILAKFGEGAFDAGQSLLSRLLS